MRTSLPVMCAESKVYSSFDQDFRDVPGGATRGFGGFAVVGMPINLYRRGRPTCRHPSWIEVVGIGAEKTVFRSFPLR
jgi:hypothetical protein